MQTQWLEFWYAALGTPFGISLLVSDPEPCRQALYRARAAAADPALDGLQVRVRGDDRLWIVKGAADATGTAKGDGASGRTRAS